MLDSYAIPGQGGGGGGGAGVQHQNVPQQWQLLDISNHESVYLCSVETSTCIQTTSVNWAC